MYARLGLPHRPLVVLPLIAAIGTALAQDSGLGVDLQFGNDLDPSGMVGTACDADGATWLLAERKRTPTGFLYDCVPAADDYRERWNEWFLRGYLGLGYLGLGGDEGSSHLGRFNGFDDGPIFGARVDMVRPGDGSYLDFRASRIDADSEYYRLVGGRAGEYRVQLFARSQDNVLSSNAQSLWSNLGAQNLVLKPGLVRGATSQAQLDAFMAANPASRISVSRDKHGLGLNWFLDPRWTVFFNASHESREGSRPFGGPFSFGRLVEVLRPIDDSTSNFNGGLRFAGNDWRMEFTYTGSFFRNGMDHFTYEMPYTTNNNNPVGLFSYEPENDYHRIGATFTRKIRAKWNGEFSLVAALTSMRQDEALVPGLLACTGMLNATINCNNWNTPAALSRSNADLGIDNQRLAGKLVLQPSRNLTWRSQLNFLREDYDGTYVAYNPLTGQYGYIGENGAFPNTTWMPGASNNVHIGNLPLDKETLEFSSGVDWRLGNRNTLGATLGHTRIERTNREYDVTTDDSLKLTWVNRSNDWLTLRVNYAFLDRRGDDYNFDPYEFMYTHHAPGFVEPANGVAPHTTTALRKYDVGEKRQNKLDLMTTFVLPNDMTVYASVRAEDNDHDALIGRYGYDTMAASLQWEWQPGTATTVSAWYAYDRSKLRVANTNDVNTGRDPGLGGTPPANGGNAAYPDGYRWWMSDTQRNHTLGSNFRHRIGRATLDLDWSYIRAKGITAWVAETSFASPTATVAGLSGAFPDMTYRVNSLSASLHMPVGQRTAVRLFGNWERGRVFDWHYAGFDNDRTTGNLIYIDGGPEDYNARLFGVMMEVKL